MSNDLESVLPQALQQLGHQAPVTELDASRVRRSVRRRQLMISAPVAAVLAVVVILASVVLSRPGPGHSAAGPRGSACAPLQTGPIPVWARAGFTGNGYPPFAYSRSGDLVAIVFGDPLTAPSAGDHNNKILWVQRDPVDYEMTMTAHLEGGDRVVTKNVTVGPSIVDMPAAGCWVMDVRIGDRHDQIALRWVAS